MPITLVTGSPGHGKTLFVVHTILKDLLSQGRVIYTNIKGISIPDPLVIYVPDDKIPRWHDLTETGAIWIIDECQRIFPRRGPTASVPVHVSGLETHRHLGLDFIIITQHPTLIDPHVLHLCEDHKHVFRAYGLARASVFTYPRVNFSPGPRMTERDGNRVNFSYPREVFQYYKSAEVHTVRARLPWRFILSGLALVLVFAAIAWKIHSFVTDPPQLQLAQREPEENFDGDRCFAVARYVGSDMIVLRPVAGRFQISERLEHNGEILERCTERNRRP